MDTLTSEGRRVVVKATMSATQKRALDNLRAVERERATAVRKIDAKRLKAMRKAIEVGVPVTDVAKAIDRHRTRVYQMLDEVGAAAS